LADWQNQRAQLLVQLDQAQGQHLVIVGFGPHHCYHDEWVYNEADIDSAKMISPPAEQRKNCELANHFKHRRMWSIKVDGHGQVPASNPIRRIGGLRNAPVQIQLERSKLTLFAGQPAI
jgi:hypothetical protein